MGRAGAEALVRPLHELQAAGSWGQPGRQPGPPALAARPRQPYQLSRLACTASQYRPAMPRPATAGGLWLAGLAWACTAGGLVAPGAARPQGVAAPLCWLPCGWPGRAGRLATGAATTVRERATNLLAGQPAPGAG